ncbi:MAG: metallophosphoesterase ['Candidatus Kapabacteria' thiocyanatum]|uniref:Calcineurin-like phosphoesterase domain-containing protein n=1 Tax=Candidatus Kapaibacterium thiocyanatum TaxID=1895771 RepID=A0A1M3KXQ2_9BACT|nr:metallophosphoesterase ['Candidatus Kapabacteria' thiocyanatum]OJX57192.1 MAG: hypothetical protein BGO89_11900 ['Candidatus Kapabacteria' thiocyanatum]
MNPPNLITFSIWVGVIQAVMDLYVLSRWTSFVRGNDMNRWWYRSSWIVAAVMFCIYWYVVYRRHFFRMDGFDVFLFGIVTLWTLPKIGILPVLLIRDIVQGIRWIVGKMRRPAAKVSPVETQATHDGTRRAFLSKAGWATAVVPYAMVGNGMYRTLYDFKVHRIDVPLPNLPKAFDGMRIVQISDVHAGSFPDHRPFQEARRMIDELKPDSIVITGDFVNALPRELTTLGRELELLKAPEGVYASLGNHDHYNTAEEHRQLIKAIEDRGIDLLVNRHRRLSIGNESIVIAGTDNTGFKQQYARLGSTLDGVSENDAVILLAHDPTYWEKAILGKTPVGLMLSGHTHGGQFGVNLLGFEWSPAQYVYKQWAGLYRTGSQYVYVNRGLGTVGPPLRIGVPPEITEITLRRA